jgi:hypothetical protein
MCNYFILYSSVVVTYSDEVPCVNWQVKWSFVNSPTNSSSNQNMV